MFPTDSGLITKLHTKNDHFYDGLYRLEEQYAIRGMLSDGIRAILLQTEKTYLPHAHILCIIADEANEKIYCKFRNVEEFCDSINEQITEKCNIYQLNRLDQKIRLRQGPDDTWILSGLVEARWDDRPFEDYEYYRYYGKVVRNYKAKYEIIDSETGDWQGKAGYYGCETEYECDDLSADEAKTLIEKERSTAVEYLTRNLDLAFERYGKSWDELLPDLRGRVVGADGEIPVKKQSECRAGEYYVSSLDGMIIMATRIYKEELGLRRYNVGADGIPFWDWAPGMLEMDLERGRTELWKISDELLEEWDIKSVREKSQHRSPYPAQWFEELRRRAADTEKEWLDCIASKAVTEYEGALRECQNAERYQLFANKPFPEKIDEAERTVNASHDHYDREHYTMLRFWGHLNPPGASCILLSILKDVCWNNIYHKNELFLIHSEESDISADEMINIGIELRGGIEEMRKQYPHIEITVYMIEFVDKKLEEYEHIKYYKDLETGEGWKWTYRTTPFYSREDGWWYEKPVKCAL